VRREDRGGQRGGPPRQEQQPPWPTPFPLPEDTASALKARRQECANLGLWLDRYVDWEQGKSGLQQAMATKKRHAPMLKRDPLGVMEMGGETAALVAACQKRCESQRESLRSQGYHVSDTLVASPEYRLVVGFGAEHVLETSLSLHRIYGFPLIPGSSVKGVARAHAFWEIAERAGVPTVSPEASENERREEKTPLQLLDQLLSEGVPKNQEVRLERLKNHPACRETAELRSLDVEKWSALARDFYEVFGTTERRGGVTFLDAYPVGAPKLEPDVLNPHYTKYYGGGPTPPANYFEPVPTYFLTVARGSRFRFAIAGRDRKLVTLAEGWLGGALEEFGIGSKTASGYGLMALEGAARAGERGAPALSLDPDSQKADELIRGVEALRTQDVAGRINEFYEKWHGAKLSDPQKARVAAAIIKKVRQANREKVSSQKAWYRELLESATAEGN
jgi:CRISPR-associated protein Cmr6